MCIPYYIYTTHHSCKTYEEEDETRKIIHLKPYVLQRVAVHTATHCNIIHLKPMKKKMKRGKRVIRIKKSDQGASQSVAVAERCSVLQCVAVCFNVLQYVAVCCSMLQCALQHTATHCNTLHYTATHCNTWRQVTSSLSLACTRVAVCCGVLRCVAVCCTDVRRGRWRKKEASSASHKVNNSLSRMYLKIYIYS